MMIIIIIIIIIIITTTFYTHRRHTSMLPAGFDPAIPASERPQTYELASATTRISTIKHYVTKM
jgi:hypothetical protein